MPETPKSELEKTEQFLSEPRTKEFPSLVRHLDKKLVELRKETKEKKEAVFPISGFPDNQFV